MTNEEKKYWSLEGEKIRVGKKQVFSVNGLYIISFLICLLSFVIVILSSTRAFIANQLTAIISIIMGVILFFYGFGMNKIAKKANKLIMEKYDQESLDKHQKQLNDR